MQYPVLEPLGAYTDLITPAVRAARGDIRYARAKERPRQCLTCSSAVSRGPETRARPPDMSTCVVGNETARLEAEAAYRGGALANMPTREMH